MGCLVTRLPRTEKGRRMLLWWRDWNGFREIYPDGVRHSDIDWDVLAADCEMADPAYFQEPA